MSGSITQLVRTLVNVGATPEMILAAVETAEASKDAALEASREKARSRFHKWKANNPANVSKRSQTLANDSKQLAGGEDSSSKVLDKEERKKEDASPSAQPKRATRLPADWVLPLDWHDEAVKAGLPVNRVLIEADKLRNWSLSAKNGAKLNWLATWRNWYRGAIDSLPRTTDPPPKKITHANMWTAEAVAMGIIDDPASKSDRRLETSLPRGQNQGTGVARRIASA